MELRRCETYPVEIHAIKCILTQKAEKVLDERAAVRRCADHVTEHFLGRTRIIECPASESHKCLEAGILAF